MKGRWLYKHKKHCPDLQCNVKSSFRKEMIGSVASIGMHAAIGVGYQSDESVTCRRPDVKKGQI